MAEEKKQNDDWVEALRELEALDRRRELRKAITPKPVQTVEQSPTPAPIDEAESAVRVPVEETPAPIREQRMSRYEELCKKPSMKKMKSEDLRVMTELSEIMCSVNRAAQKLHRFEERWGETVPISKYRTWEQNLKETASIMMHEFHALRHGKENKVYDRRNVCQKCHSVFMAPLPEGICDECRSRMDSHTGEY